MTNKKVITFHIEEDDQKCLDLIREKYPAAKSGVVAIRMALSDFYNRHGPHPEGKEEKDADLKEIKAQLAGVSTAELKSLMLEILLEIKKGDD